jgi:nitroimidazol reductase NimA-like FMN-containing flavoprotein (pyridoxamine 5'-phosphate oxidase superfamily)
MDQHEIDAELGAAAALLDGTQFAHLAYTAADGTPRVVPIGIYWTGTEFVVSTSDTAPKVRALQDRPDVALSVVSGGDSPADATSLSVRGRAEVRIVDGVTEEYLAASRRSMEPEAAAQFEVAVRQMYPRMARIGIRPRWARFYDFGAGRVPRFMQELAARAAGG